MLPNPQKSGYGWLLGATQSLARLGVNVCLDSHGARFPPELLAFSNSKPCFLVIPSPQLLCFDKPGFIPLCFLIHSQSSTGPRDQSFCAQLGCLAQEACSVLTWQSRPGCFFSLRSRDSDLSSPHGFNNKWVRKWEEACFITIWSFALPLPSCDHISSLETLRNALPGNDGSLTDGTELQFGEQ